MKISRLFSTTNPSQSKIFVHDIFDMKFRASLDTLALIISCCFYSKFGIYRPDTYLNLFSQK